MIKDWQVLVNFPVGSVVDLLSFVRGVPEAIILASFKIQPPVSWVRSPRSREFAEFVSQFLVVGAFASDPVPETGAASLGKASRS